MPSDHFEVYLIRIFCPTTETKHRAVNEVKGSLYLFIDTLERFEIETHNAW